MRHKAICVLVMCGVTLAVATAQLKTPERLEFMARHAVAIPASPRGLPGQPRD